MAEEDDSGKTEEPTQRKLEEARRRGQVPMSREVNHFMMILAGTLIVLTVATSLGNHLGAKLTYFVNHLGEIPASNMAEVGAALVEALKAGLSALLLPFLAFVVAGFAATMVQIGPMWAVENLMPKLERISLIKGVQRLFSKRSLVEFLKGILKIVVVAAVAIWLMAPVMPGIEHVIDLPPSDLMGEVREIAIRLFGGVLAIVTVITLLDYMFQRQQFLSEMKMSRSELKEEFKQTEGDPQIRQRIRQIRMERARKRMMAEVPKADVVVTNPEHYAVALQYKPEEHVAPVVVAMGADIIAQKIKEVAREAEVPIVENPPLARALYATAELDRPIPSEHYRAVAEIISYVFKLKNKGVKKT